MTEASGGYLLKSGNLADYFLPDTNLTLTYSVSGVWRSSVFPEYSYMSALVDDAPVPEPGSWGTAALGLGAAMAARRFARRRCRR